MPAAPWSMTAWLWRRRFPSLSAVDRGQLVATQTRTRSTKCRSLRTRTDPPAARRPDTELGRLSVLHSPDVDLWKRRGQPVSLCIHRDQGDHEIVFSQHIVHFNTKRAPRKLHDALKEGADLIVATIVA